MLKHRLLKPGGRLTRKKIKAKRKFLYFFPGGFDSEKYLGWERAARWNAHEDWKRLLNLTSFRQLLAAGQFSTITKRAIDIVARSDMLFALEKISLAHAIDKPEGARVFAEGLYNYTYGTGTMQENFENFRLALSKLSQNPRRVHTWPVQTVFGFIAHPTRHILLKPMITKAAAKKYDYDLLYKAAPSWETYESLLDFTATIRKDISGLHPRDYIDLQFFITVLGADKYPD